MLKDIKKSVLALWGWTVLFLPVSSCFAAISTDQIAIGGIGPGCTTSYVENIYGTPASSQNITAYTGADYLEYNYGGRFLIGFSTANSQTIYATCTADNLKTPAGVTVGMTADVLSSAYGTADHLYNYNDKTLYEYSDGSGNTLSFDVQNFYIISINVRTAM